MNKKGQALVMFVLLVPIIILIIVFLIDVLSANNYKNKGENLLYEAINLNADIEKYFNDNEIVIDSISKNNDCYTIEYNYETIFAKIIGKKEFKIEITNCKE